MDYRGSQPLRVPAESALLPAEAALSRLGFRLLVRTGGRLVVEGPGLVSTRQHPLKGASRITIEVEDGRMLLTAELGGVREMTGFLRTFPTVLGLVLIGMFAILFAGVGQFGRIGVAHLAVTLATAPWLLVAPLMTRRIRSRTTRALAAFLENLAAGGREGQFVNLPAKGPRRGRENAAQDLAARRKDKLLDPQVPIRFDDEKWEW